MKLYSFIKDGNTYNVVDNDSYILGFIVRNKKHYFEPIGSFNVFGVEAMREIADFLYMLDNRKKFKGIKNSD